MSVDEQIEALIKVTAWVITSMTYARFASSILKPGKLRLLSLLPVILLLPYLPWYFTSVNLRGGFTFLLAWLGVFKLLLLSFGVGPLSPSLPLSTFITSSSLPVKLRPPQSPPSSNSLFIFATTCIKALLLVLIFPIYSYKSSINPYLLLVIYSLHIYLILEISLATAGFLAGSLGLDIEPQFDAPLKSSSLQEFWGRRWNLMVTSILRPFVYYPIRSRFGTASGVMAAFLVSGLMHEVVFFYMTVERPTGEVTSFFVIQGLSTIVEVKAKKGGWWRPMHRVVAVPMTLGFVVVTAFLLFFPPFLRGKVEEKWLEEYVELARLVEMGGQAMLRRLTG